MIGIEVVYEQLADEFDDLGNLSDSLQMWQPRHLPLVYLGPKIYER